MVEKHFDTYEDAKLWWTQQFEKFHIEFHVTYVWREPKQKGYYVCKAPCEIIYICLYHGVEPISLYTKELPPTSIAASW